MKTDTIATQMLVILPVAGSLLPAFLAGSQPVFFFNQSDLLLNYFGKISGSETTCCCSQLTKKKSPPDNRRVKQLS